MSNQHKMAMVETVMRLLQQGWSYRRIARELGIHRESVARLAGKSKPAKAPLGARRRLAEVQAKAPRPEPLTAELRAAFADVGRRLPDTWPGLSAEAKKRLLRTLITGVNLRREENGMVQMRTSSRIY